MGIHHLNHRLPRIYSVLQFVCVAVRECCSASHHLKIAQRIHAHRYSGSGIHHLDHRCIVCCSLCLLQCMLQCVLWCSASHHLKITQRILVHRCSGIRHLGNRLPRVASWREKALQIFPTQNSATFLSTKKNPFRCL